MKRPPYAAQIDPQAKRIGVLVGDWETAKRLNQIVSSMVVLPFGDDPSEFDWSFVQGRAVVVENCTSEHAADTIGTELMAYGARTCSVFGAHLLYQACHINGRLHVDQWHG